jgi:hypothetical protein
MKLDEFRRQMAWYRVAVDEEARSLKDSYVALDRLHRLYQKFDDQEKAMADHVISEWVLSEDENVRFDALALINDFKIATTKTALQKLANHLALSNAPGAPYELAKVHRIIRDLSDK